MSIVLYTTHCPRCKVLTAKLDSAAIQYEICDNVDEMIKKDIKSVPVLEVDGNLLDFKAAVDWVNNGGKSN